MKYVGFSALGFLGLFLILFILGSWFTVDQGERGVMLRNGAFVSVEEPGLGFKTPFIDSVVKISTQSRLVAWEKVETYSKDQQLADMRVSVNYHMPESRVADIYSTYGSESALVERLIAPRMFQELKVVFGQYTATDAIQKRDRLNIDVKEAILRAIGDNALAIIDGVQIEDLAFSPAYNESIEARMRAEVEVAQVAQNANKEVQTAKITVTKAEAARDSIKAKADGDAYAVRVAAEAESYRIEQTRLAQAKGIKAENDARLAAIQTNPLIIDYLMKSTWNGVLPTTMLPNSSVPMLNLSTAP